MNKTENRKKGSESSKNHKVTMPIQAVDLVSKVNSLTGNSASNTIINPQHKLVLTDKSTLLDYKYIVQELPKLADITNVNEYFTRIFSVITQNIESAFLAIGIYKEKSNTRG